MKKLVNVLSWVSFIIIIAAYGVASMGAGCYAATKFNESLNLQGWWCLLGVFPLFVVGTATALFVILGLKKFGNNE